MNTDALTHFLWRNLAVDPNLCVYSLQDGAANSRLFANLSASNEESACLYAGPIPQSLAITAPYLVRLIQASLYTPWLLKSGWGKAWGVFCHSHSGLQALRRHFQGLLSIVDDSGNKMMFRYYDPRILRAYLPTCTPEELRVFFGPVFCFFAEGEDKEHLLCFYLESGRLVTEKIPLTPALAT